uniref:Putative glycosyltransferase n=1 Tax=viral metagenome TaxID=1070528 RepID=A0A6M3LDK7_9ZZZZ
MVIRLSLIIPFLNSQEVVRRQVIYMRRQDYPDDVEIIFLDDGSDPPLKVENPPKNFCLHATNDFRKWTSSLARNTGAKLARGEYLFMTDGDYIVSREAMERARRFTGDRLGCRREFGVLTEAGELTQDHAVLMEYGLVPQRIRERGTKMPPHPNNFVMRKTLFEEMGGYDEKLILTRDYPQKEDTDFKRRLAKLRDAGKIVMSDDARPVLFMFPNGQYCGDVDYNPFGLFHTLTRKTPHNHWYMNPRYKQKSAERSSS